MIGSESKVHCESDSCQALPGYLPTSHHSYAFLGCTWSASCVAVIINKNKNKGSVFQSAFSWGVKMTRFDNGMAMGAAHSQNVLCAGVPCPWLSVLCPCLRVPGCGVCLATQTGKTMPTSTTAEATPQVSLPRCSHCMPFACACLAPGCACLPVPFVLPRKPTG